MKITTLAINVSCGQGNRAVVMDLFFFIDVIFILNLPLMAEGLHVAQETGVFDLFSFVLGSGIEVYVNSHLVGLVEVIDYGVDGVSIGFLDNGCWRVVRGVYIRPGVVRDEWDAMETP